MKRTTRATALVLALSLILLLFAPPAHAAEHEIQTIQILIDSSTRPQPFAVIAHQQELYLRAEDFERITRYRLAETADKRLIFLLGIKQVAVDPLHQTIQAGGRRFPCKQPISQLGQVWLPLSDLLPWLNTHVSVTDGMLQITSDPVSIWEVQREFGLNLTDYLFNIEEEFRDKKGALTTMITMLLMDTLLKVRLDRAIPYKDASRREYQVYLNAFRDFASDDFFVSSLVEDTMDLGGGLHDIKQAAAALGLGADSVFAWQDSLPTAAGPLLGHAADALDIFGAALDKVKALDDAVKLKEMAGAFSIIEASLNASAEYHLSFAYIYGSDSVRPRHTVAEEAARRSYLAYRDQQDAIGIAALEYMTRSLTDIGRDYMTGSLASKAVSSATVYLKAIDAALGVIWPINKGAEEIANLNVYVNIQHDALDSYHRYEGLSIRTEEDITAMRLSAMMFLKAGKKAVQAKQSLIDPFGGKNLHDWQIAAFDQMLTRFALSAAAAKNDANTDKTSLSRELLALFAEVTRLEHAPPGSEMGNTRGNVVNGGLAVLDEDQVTHLGMVAYHYAAYPFSFALFRTKTDQSTVQPVDVDQGIIGHLNSLNGKLYYVRNHQLYAAGPDGSQAELLADNVLGDVSVVNDAIYFVQYNIDAAADEKYQNGPLQKIMPDGSSRTSLTTARAGSVNVVDDLIYFLDLDQGGRLCAVRTDGSDLQSFEQVRAGQMIIDNGWIYFTNREDNHRLYRVRPDGSRLEKVTDDAVSAFNVHQDVLYYAASSENYSLHRISVDGTDRRQLLNKRVWQINIVADRLYYLSETQIGMIPLDDLSSSQIIPDPSLLYPDLPSPGGAVIVHYDQSSNPLNIRQHTKLDLRRNILDAFQAWNSPQNLIRNRTEHQSCLAIAGEIYNVVVAITVLNTDMHAFMAYQAGKLADMMLILDHFTDHSAYVIVITYDDRLGHSHAISLTRSDTYNPRFFTVYKSEAVLPLP